MNRSSFWKGLSVIAVVCAAVLLVGGTAQAAPPDLECSHIGSWFGQVNDGAITWMGTISPGTFPNRGQLYLELTKIDWTFGGQFPVVTGTNCSGLWKMIDRSTFKYTFFTYGYGADGNPFYIARTSGTLYLTDCDNENLDYEICFFFPWLGQDDLEGACPEGQSSTGTGSQKRMKLVP
jgi:hypothetical protein